MKWKQIIGLVSCFLFLINNSTVVVSAQAKAAEPTITAESAIVVDAVNGQILYQKNPLVLSETGNVSKLLSLLVIYEALDQGIINLDDQVSISNDVYQMSQDYNISNVPLRQDYQYSVAELLEAVSIGSANGALLALAEHTAGSKAEFQQLMLQKLETILSAETRFDDVTKAEWQALQVSVVNVTGLPDDYQPNNISASGKTNQLNAMLLAIISYQLISKHPEILESTQQSRKIFRENSDDQFEMQNLNGMLKEANYAYDGTEGLIVSSDNNKATVVEVTNRNGLRVITIVQAAKDNITAYNEAKKILEYIYATYQLQHVVTKNDTMRQLKQLELFNADPQQVSTYYMEDLDLVTPIIDTTPRFEYQFEPDTSVLNVESDGAYTITKSLTAGQKVGSVVADIKQTPLQFIPTSKSNRVDIAVGQSVTEANFIVNMWRGTGKTIGEGLDGMRQFFTNIFN